MPYLDKRTGEIVVRIVYDGAPEAGKTTNVRQLGASLSLQRRGALESPGTSGARTEFFDWLDFAGGFVDGRRVRCQLVSVPGQSRLLHRRRYLLGTADAIVFVVDSHREQVLEARVNLEATRRILASFPEPPAEVVVQANKQDQPGALKVAEVAELLGLPPTVPIVPSVAVTGEGLMDAFILASRLATQRVRSLRGEPPDLEVGQEAPASLHAIVAALPEDAVAPAGAAAPVQAVPRAARSLNHVTKEAASALHPDIELSAGHVWPPVKGRAMLTTADLASLEAPELAQPWAPTDPIELRTANGWIFQSSLRWFFDDAGRARLDLMAVVRAQTGWFEFLPDLRAVFLSGNPPGWRLWVLTGPVTSVREAFIAALEARDELVVTRILEAATSFTTASANDPARRLLGWEELGFDAVHGKLQVLVPVLPSRGVSDTSPGVLEELKRALSGRTPHPQRGME